MRRKSRLSVVLYFEKGGTTMPGSYYLPAVNLIDFGAVAKVGSWIRTLGGSRVLIAAAAAHPGEEHAALAAEHLSREGIASVPFVKVLPNPTDVLVEEGAALYRAERCDALVAIGGGSAMDCTKAIGAVVTNGGSIRDYEGTNRLRIALPPFVAINTTAGTGSEITRFAVITDTERHVKMTLADWRLTPDVSINDPELMLSMPPGLTAATGMDALSHAVESLVSLNASPLTEALSLKAARLVFDFLPRAVRDGNDREAREMMTHAAFLAGAAFNNSGLGLVHAMSHPLGAKYNLPHGVLNALLLPHVERYNAVTCFEKFSLLGEHLGIVRSWHSSGENAETTLQAMGRLAEDVGIPASLARLGVKSEDLGELARQADQEEIGRTNPRKASVETIRELYRAAM
ncbi:iron-containing alcohol dehydrogenase [Aminiphilus sp.]|jgi:alcohol dehydrogenase|uniref:iron-containing alcohol dehydrogenase n=1 Tax=Aminiphilus sp. TaxID=1872488 RepID=UPI00262BECC5|nr:iron-containing alcohol dehydrogenase [Aminiphilus sp.]